MLAAYVAGTLLCMSVESLMVYTMPDSEKGRASGWLQAGNLGGGGLGGGAGLWMAKHLPGAWMAGAVLGAASTLCCFALPFVPERQTASGNRRFIGDVPSVLRDLWRVARSRIGFLALLIVFLPIGTRFLSLMPRAGNSFAMQSAQNASFGFLPGGASSGILVRPRI